MKFVRSLIVQAAAVATSNTSTISEIAASSTISSLPDPSSPIETDLVDMARYWPVSLSTYHFLCHIFRIFSCSAAGLGFARAVGDGPNLACLIRRCLEAKATPLVSQLLEMLDATSQRLRLVCGLFGEEVSV